MLKKEDSSEEEDKLIEQYENINQTISLYI